MTKAEAAALLREGIPTGGATVRCVAFLTPEEAKRMRTNRWLGCIGLEGNKPLGRGRALRLALQCFLKTQEAGS